MDASKRPGLSVFEFPTSEKLEPTCPRRTDQREATANANLYETLAIASASTSSSRDLVGKITVSKGAAHLEKLILRTSFNVCCSVRVVNRRFRRLPRLYVRSVLARKANRVHVP